MGRKKQNIKDTWRDTFQVFWPSAENRRLMQKMFSAKRLMGYCRHPAGRVGSFHPQVCDSHNLRTKRRRSLKLIPYVHEVWVFVKTVESMLAEDFKESHFLSRGLEISFCCNSDHIYTTQTPSVINGLTVDIHQICELNRTNFFLRYRSRNKTF